MVDCRMPTERKVEGHNRLERSVCLSCSVPGNEAVEIEGHGGLLLVARK